jgi:hypothetical protein
MLTHVYTYCSAWLHICLHTPLHTCLLKLFVHHNLELRAHKTEKLSRIYFLNIFSKCSDWFINPLLNTACDFYLMLLHLSTILS